MLPVKIVHGQVENLQGLQPRALDRLQKTAEMVQLDRLPRQAGADVERPKRGMGVECFGQEDRAVEAAAREDSEGGVGRARRSIVHGRSL